MEVCTLRMWTRRPSEVGGNTEPSWTETENSAEREASAKALGPGQAGSSI